MSSFRMWFNDYLVREGYCLYNRHLSVWKNAKFCKSVFVKIIDILFNVKIFEQFSELMKSNHQHIFRNEHILTIQLCMTETKAVDTIGNYSK